jgi:hypothetical protein
MKRDAAKPGGALAGTAEDSTMRRFDSSSILNATHVTFSDLKPALRAMLRAWHFAHDLGESPWEFAVEIRALRDFGMTDSDLRWLVAKGLAEFAEDSRKPGRGPRRFRRRNRLPFNDRSCFVLTENGSALILERFMTKSAGPQPTVERSEQKPIWNSEVRELRFENAVVKRYRVPAPMQELILKVFQEEGWPRRIDDPLPPSTEVSAKDRLQDAIKSLNRNQRPFRIRFGGNGEANGVIWEPAK